MQASVEREHFGKRGTTDSLTRSVMRSWAIKDDSDVLTKVFSRLETVMLNLLEGDGSNDLVESSRGRSKKKRNWKKLFGKSIDMMIRHKILMFRKPLFLVKMSKNLRMK